MKLTNPFSAVKKKSCQQEILLLNLFLSVNYLWSKDKHFNLKVSVEIFFSLQIKIIKAFMHKFYHQQFLWNSKHPFIYYNVLSKNIKQIQHKIRLCFPGMV